MSCKKFKYISIAGVDDGVSVQDLRDLSLAFPFVEWSVLYLPGGEARPRYPSVAWRRGFWTESFENTAVHLCGVKACRQLLASELPRDLFAARRWQINANEKAFLTRDELLSTYLKALEPAHLELILQYHAGTAGAIHQLLGQLSPGQLARVSVLLDSSGGKGIAPATHAIPAGLADAGVTIGYAGNIGSHNVAEVAATVAGHKPYWLDLESGARCSSNRFSIDACTAILEKAKSWAEATSEIIYEQA